MDDRPLSTSDLAGASASDSQRLADGSAPDSRGTAAQPGGDPGLMSQPAGQANQAEPLFPVEQSTQFRDQWHDIQAGFVDEPRESVKQADALVADLMQRLASEFAGERQNLERQWDRGDDVSTEDLRVALQRYRSFFDRLLAA